jgi:hypothetical protein
MHRTLSALALAAALAACTADDPAPAADTTETAEPRTDDTDDGATTEAPPAAGGPDGTITLSGVQQAHPGGSVVAVTAVTVDDGDLYLDVEVHVAAEQGASMSAREMSLTDNLGNTYEFVEPPVSLDFATDSEAALTFAFVGPVAPDATRVTLGINAIGDPVDAADDLTNARYPKFALRDLPLPGVGLDAEAAADGDPVGLQLDPTTIDVDGVTHEGAAQVLVEVTRIEVTPVTVAVTIEGRNGSERDKQVLVRDPVLRAEMSGLTFDRRFEYRQLTADDGSRDTLPLAPGEEFTARLVFVGAVPADADALRLGLQTLTAEVDRGQVSEERAVSNPTVVFTGLPLPDRHGDVR